MSGHLCIPVVKKCYAIMYSYGEICCHTNCCGRFGKGLKMWQARLRYEKEELKRNKNFDRWIPEWRETQEKNIKKNIAYTERKIKHIKERIRHFKEM